MRAPKRETKTAGRSANWRAKITRDGSLFFSKGKLRELIKITSGGE
jgi:hypothetical protein